MRWVVTCLSPGDCCLNGLRPEERKRPVAAKHPRPDPGQLCLQLPFEMLRVGFLTNLGGILLLMS